MASRALARQLPAPVGLAVDRALARLLTGPVGHAVGGALDWVSLVTRLVVAGAQRRLREARSADRIRRVQP